MKYLLILLSSFLLHQVQAQKSGIYVSVQNKSVNVNLEDEDQSKVLTINRKSKSVATGRFTIINADWGKEKELKRTFTIYTDSDQSISKIPAGKTSGKYEIALKTLVTKMKQGEVYNLYTIAIPKDPSKAALVRVRRVFLCRISVT